MDKTYTVFKIPKRNGKFRTIEAPNDELKAAQREDMARLEKLYKVSPFAHGFAPYKNIVTMAMAHVNKPWVMAVDIADFFPSIKYKHFQNFVDSKANKLLDLHWHDFGDGKGERLPQGSPASPFLSNAYLFKFDWQMAWLANKMNCDYSRYADDIVISGDSKNLLVTLLGIIKNKFDFLHLKINSKKTKFMHRTGRQLVCGVVVNEKLNLKRRWRKNLRAEIFQQMQAQKRKKKKTLRNDTEGRLAFQKMVRENEKTTHSSREICKSILVSQMFDKSILEG